ncbi:MAG TPA: hypothetical protein VK891_13435 [Euzebyales bacterium]|nr:hypothetical protein [Euzebyales bacterium]
MADDLLRLAFDLGPNEASGLETFFNQRVLADHEWDVAFWAVLDDVDVRDAIGAIGHRFGEPLDRGWAAERLHATTPADLGETEDAEAVCHHRGWIYVFGSHFGNKAGPLQRKRQFVARFNEDGVVDAFGGDPVELEVRRTGLHDGLHRVINDALAERGVELLTPGPQVRAAFCEGGDDRPEDMRPRAGDQPINIEGAEFLADGTAFVGLRWPVTADGRPLVVAIAGIPEWFEDGDLPRVSAVHVVEAVGEGGTLAGVRDLSIATGRLHVVTGNIDSREKDSVLLEDHPEGADTVNTHFSCALPPADRDTQVAAERVRAFPDMPRIEGIAVEFGHVFYVSDEDDGVDMRFTPLIVAERT